MTLDITKLTAEEKGRLWERMLHEDNLLNERFNYFIALESALFGVFGVLYTANPVNMSALRVISVLGFVITLISWIVQGKQKRILDSLERFISEAGFQEYIMSLHAKEIRFPLWRIDSSLFMSIIIPTIAVLLWIGLLIVALIS